MNERRPPYEYRKFGSHKVFFHYHRFIPRSVQGLLHVGQGYQVSILGQWKDDFADGRNIYGDAAKSWEIAVIPPKEERPILDVREWQTREEVAGYIEEKIAKYGRKK